MPHAQHGEAPRHRAQWNGATRCHASGRRCPQRLINHLTQNTAMTLEQRIRAPDPKKILTMDGGGVLGVISVEIRARIEGMLRSPALMYAAKNEQDSLCRAFASARPGCLSIVRWAT